MTKRSTNSLTRLTRQISCKMYECFNEISFNIPNGTNDKVPT